MGVKLDEIGPWLEVKLDIVKKYASAYTTVLKSFPAIRKYLYISMLSPARERTFANRPAKW